MSWSFAQSLRPASRASEDARSRGAPDERGAPADAQVIALAREAPAEALDVIYGAYRIRIHSFLLRLVGDPETADDVSQETFTKAYRAIGTLSETHAVLPWLYRIANNTAIDHLRRRKRSPWVAIAGLIGTREEPTARAGQDGVPEREHLRTVLAGLPPENAAALLLHAVEGYSYKEIAEIQGCTLTAVRSRIARARAGFKATYGPGAPATK